ncbi:MAG: S46 family peptidase [Bacteroidales bacterium]|nr:S46 family peptidase [Bacteroidales bacterium]
MQKKKLLLIVGVLCMSIFTAKADEGMWPVSMINQQNIKEMQELGCRLTAEQIVSFNLSSVKDAIVQFGGGCTGEIVSPEGLLFTNHHCGYSQVQAHSAPEHDYLKDGFWAYSKKEELPNPGLTVWFLLNVEDVTDAILEGVTANMTEEERDKIVAENKKALTEKASEENENRISIEEFYRGNQYLKFEYVVYKDIRLVGVPPSSIGKFGGDTDNWMWPRQTGDFCIFRVYTAPDGSPAEYAEENIPLKPKHYLPVSIKGVQEDDFAMILGYPGSTDRYAPSKRIESVIHETAPVTVECREVKLAQYRKHMLADRDVFIKYANKHAGVSNYWKNSIGQIKQLQNNKVVEKRQALEKQFSTWAALNNPNMLKYGNVLSDYDKAYAELSKYNRALRYHIEAGLRGSEAISLAQALINANTFIVEKKKEEFEKDLPRYQKRINDFFKDYDAATDRDVTIALLNLFYQNIPADLQPELLQKTGKSNGGDFTKYVDNAFKKSIFVSEAKMKAWLEKPYSLNNDPFMQMAQSMWNSYQALLKKMEPALMDIERCDRLFIAGLQEMQPEKNFYPDANFTMRLTYGSVKPYAPRDAVDYHYVTTLKGVMEKEIPDHHEFDVAPKLKQLYEKQDFGQYADENGKMIVNFLTTNDITGGNSGSPVLDADGNLIGLAFDGNWEAMSGDIAFEPALQRTICVDARYVLFIIDKFANAQNLIQELTIVK